MSELPNCPKCNSEYTYQDRGLYVCPECAHEWGADSVEEGGDEERKINVNTATAEVLNDFFELVVETSSQEAADISDSIVDWRDCHHFGFHSWVWRNEPFLGSGARRDAAQFQSRFHRRPRSKHQCREGS